MQITHAKKAGRLQLHSVLNEQTKKKEEILTFATKQKSPEDFMLSEISQEQKGKCCSPSLYKHSKKSNSQKLRVK